MFPTHYPEVNRLLVDLLAALQNNLGERLVGLYLYGSLIWGDFDLECSDIDLLAATTSPIEETTLAQLTAVHAQLAQHHPRWEGRVEVQYCATSALSTFKTQRHSMANISPGEPLHIIEAGREWLTNWYFVQDYGVPLWGADPQTFIPPITKAEFVQAVREHAQEWATTYIVQTRLSRPYQSYAILTLCRAFYTCTFGEQVSKIKAAAWAQTQLPEWADLIQQALLWRKDFRIVNDPERTYPITEQFVHAVQARIEGS